MMINAPCGKRRPNKTYHGQRLTNVFTLPFHFSVEKIVAPSPYHLARFPSPYRVSRFNEATSFIPPSNANEVYTNPIEVLSIRTEIKEEGKKENPPSIIPLTILSRKKNH